MVVVFFFVFYDSILLYKCSFQVSPKHSEIFVFQLRNNSNKGQKDAFSHPKSRCCKIWTAPAWLDQILALLAAASQQSMTDSERCLVGRLRSPLFFCHSFVCVRRPRRFFVIPMLPMIPLKNGPDCSIGLDLEMYSTPVLSGRK